MRIWIMTVILDLIVNNINDEAGIFRNRSKENQKNPNHFLKIKFRGDSLNRDGFGASVELHYDHGKQQVYENTPYRGYLSTVRKSRILRTGKSDHGRLRIDSLAGRETGNSYAG